MTTSDFTPAAAHSSTAPRDHLARHGDDRQIHAGRRVLHRRVRLQAADLVRPRVDRVDLAGESRPHERVDHAPADAGRVARRADDRDGPGLEHRRQRRGRGDAAAFLAARYAFERRRERELHVDVAAGRLRSDRESRVAKHLEHRRVVRERGRLEAREAGRRRAHRQPLQQRRAEPLALEPIVHREGHFRHLAGQRDVRPDRDQAHVIAHLALDEQRQAARRRRRIAERLDQAVGRLAHGEEPLAPRLWRQVVEEPADRVGVAALGGADRRDGAVPEDEPRQVDVVGRGRGGRGYLSHLRPSARRRACPA